MFANNLFFLVMIGQSTTFPQSEESIYSSLWLVRVTNSRGSSTRGKKS